MSQRSSSVWPTASWGRPRTTDRYEGRAAWWPGGRRVPPAGRLGVGPSAVGDGVEHPVRLAQGASHGIVATGPSERHGEDVMGAGGDLAARTAPAVIERRAAGGVLEHPAAGLAVPSPHTMSACTAGQTSVPASVSW